VYVRALPHNVAMAVAQGVDDPAGRAAVEIIEAARKRQVPVMTKNEAVARAGLSPAGWLKIRRTGHGREESFIAMARILGVEPEVRKALGLPPLESRRRAAFEANIMADERLTPAEQRTILGILRRPGGWELLESYAAEYRGQRQAQRA